MEDAVRPRIALPGWWVRRRLVRAAAAPSAMRTAAYVALRRRRAEGGRAGQKPADSCASGPAGTRESGRAHQPSNRPSFYLTSLAFVANLF